MIKVWVGCQRELLRLRLCVVEINLVATVDVSVLVRQTPEKRTTRVLNFPSRWIQSIGNVLTNSVIGLRGISAKY